MELYKERGIVLHSTKYGEGQLIIHMLTQGSGRRSYITRIGKKSGHNIYQPFFILEFEAQHTRTDLHKLSQAIGRPQLRNIPFDIARSTVALFLSELLYRLVVEPLDDKRMYLFVEQSVVELDTMQRGIANFHLWFMVRLAFFLGYQIDYHHNAGDWFDIRNGRFCAIEPPHTLKINPPLSALLSQIVTASSSDLGDIHMERSERRALLAAMVDYYSFHSDAMRTVRSIEILAEIF